MNYNYEEMKPWLFSEEGQRKLLKIFKACQYLLKTAGAFRFDSVPMETGTSFEQIACIDRLVELGEIEECKRPAWTQYKVYSTPERHNL